MRRRILGLALLTLVCLAFVLRDLDLESARVALATYDWRRVPIVLGLYAVALAARTERFRRLLPTPLGYGRALVVVGASHLASNVLPLHTGSLVAPYLLESTHEVPFGEGLAVVVMERVLDVVALLLLVGVAALLVQVPGTVSAEDVALLTSAARTLALGVLLMLVGLGILAVGGRRGVERATRSTARLAPWLGPIVERVAGRFVDTVRALAARPVAGAGAVLATMLWWTASMGAGAVTMGGFPALPRVTLAMVVLNQVGIVMGGSLLPSPGRIGGFEAGAIGAMVAFGAEASVAGVFALVLHLSQLTFTVLAGLTCFAIAGWRIGDVVRGVARAG